MNRKLDMTTGTGWKKVIIFAIPLMIGNILQQLYNTVDGIVVGRFVSETALAAVGNCGTLTFLFVGIASGLSNGCGIVVSQFFGAGDRGDIRKAASTSFALALSGGVIMMAIGTLGARALLGGLMNIREKDILDAAVLYIRIYSLGLVFQFIYNVTAAMMRAVGDSRASLYFLAVSTMTNLVLDLLFVLRFGLGVMGVAVATVAAQFISVIFSLTYMRRKYDIFAFGPSDIRFDPEKSRMCLKMGIPTILQSSVIGLGGVLMQRIVNHFGRTLMAAFTVGNRMENYIFIPIQGLAVGMSTFTGQNVGAGKPERVKECWKRIELSSFILSSGIALIVYVFSSRIATLFGLSGESFDLAVRMIHFLCMFCFLFALYLPTVNVLSGSGDAYFAMLCSFSTLSIRIIAAAIMVYLLGVGQHAVWTSVPIGWIVCLSLAVGRYMSGKWQEKAPVGRRN